MKLWHSMSCDETLNALNANAKGLTSAEANQRAETAGKNKLNEAKRHGVIYKFLMQLKETMVLVLLIAAVVSATLALINEEPGELIDAGIILLIVIVNAIVGVVQENKAEAALDSLQNMNKPFVKVYRDGELTKIHSEDLVPGDVVVLEAGDFVPADIRLIEAASLKIEEAALTGESLPSEKNADAVLDEKAALGDRKNMAYSGGTVAYGRGVGVVCEIGMNTEVGKIASMLENADEDATPLQKQLAVTAKYLSFIVLGIAVVIFIAKLLGPKTGGNVFMDSFMTAVAIAVAAIPEGLPAVVTVSLALGVQRMSSKNARIRRLPAVETLGSAEIICSDKTGTLTLNQMTVKKIWTPGAGIAEGGQGKSYDALMRCMVLCNDTNAMIKDGALEVTGDPTETALYQFSFAQGINPVDVELSFPRVDEIPFDSVRKLMTTVNETENGKISYTKGAPDMLLARCEYILDGDAVRPITDEDKTAIFAANSELASGALRVLAYAYKDGAIAHDDTDETALTFIGLTGMIDPPRPEVKGAVATCKGAGMTPIMITGDHAETAKAIATEIGILGKGDLVITGAALDEMSDDEFLEKIKKIRVYARVSPENKVRIVTTWKKLGKIVAMTGDGVNDAPSIKSADIGVGMGITGTDVSKSVSDMVLADDNFATIIVAVEEGRKVYSNIRKTVQYLLSANIAEVLSLFFVTMFMPEVAFLTPVMILWINLVTDSLPALALGMEAPEKDIMQQPPRKSGSSLFSGQVGANIFVQGFMQTIIVLGVFLLGLGMEKGHSESMTMAFLALGFIQLFHAYNMRDISHSLFATNPFANKFMNGAFLISCVLQVGVVALPFMHTAFGTCALSLTEWLISIGGAFLIVPLVELHKLICRKLANKKVGK